MIIIEFCGGLGNQLQQYALYRKYISLGVDAKGDFSWFQDDVQAGVSTKRNVELDRFIGVRYDTCTEDEKQQLIGLNALEKLLCKCGFGNPKVYSENSMYDPNLLRFTNKYLEGYFTCEYYYADILPKLRKEIRFPLEGYSRKTELDRLVHDIEQQYSISIHIRRGDYLDEINRQVYENICTDSYYSRSLDYCLKNIEKAKLFVFSDDPEYAMEYVARLVNGRDKLQSYEVISFNCGVDSLFDIYLMSKCDCNITANSTFSYWGARLNGKKNLVKIRPTKHKNSESFVYKELHSMWPGWIFVDPDGKVYW